MNERRQTSALAPYFVKDGEVFVYMQMRDSNARYNANKFGFFGGGVEDGETLMEALIREIKEELNIEIEEAVFFKHYDGTIADMDLFLLEVDEGFKDRVLVSEGQYGAFVPARDWENESISEFNQPAVRDIFEHIH